MKITLLKPSVCTLVLLALFPFADASAQTEVSPSYQYDLVFEPALPEVQRHLATFKKYPMKDLGLSVGR